MLSFIRVLLALCIGAASIAASADDNTTARGRTVKVNGIDLYYEEFGAGKPLVLLHGFGACAKTWQPFVAKLAEHHRLIVVDLRGHGHSTNPGNTFTQRQSASDVLALLDSLKIDRFSGMGISAGGMALLHMATRQPARVESMVLIGASPYYSNETRAVLSEFSMETAPPDVLQEFRECATRGEPQVRELVAQFNGFHKSYDDMNFTSPYLSTITARTLIVHGDRDFFFPVEIPVSVYRAIPDASLWIIPGGTHVPIFDPAVPFSATALEFLDRKENM